MPTEKDFQQIRKRGDTGAHSREADSVHPLLGEYTHQEGRTLLHQKKLKMQLTTMPNNSRKVNMCVLQ